MNRTSLFLNPGPGCVRRRLGHLEKPARSCQVLFGSAATWPLPWLFMKQCRFHIDFCGPEHPQSHCDTSLSLNYWSLLDIGRQCVFPGAAGSLAFGLSAPCQPLCVVFLGGGMWHSPNPQPTNSHLFNFPLLVSSQRTSLGKHWCILRCGWVCCGWRGFCSSSRGEEELSASTTTKGQRLWAWPWRGATRSCTSCWQSKDDLVVPLLVFCSVSCLSLHVVTEDCPKAKLYP